MLLLLVLLLFSPDGGTHQLTQSYQPGCFPPESVVLPSSQLINEHRCWIRFTCDRHPDITPSPAYRDTNHRCVSIGCWIWSVKGLMVNNLSIKVLQQQRTPFSA
jgi:hypothetical protein